MRRDCNEKNQDMKYEDKIEVRKHRRTLDRNKPFVLIGNEIDGRLFCHTHFDFKNFEELKERLPKVMKAIKGEGEWAFDLYQVPNEYKIWHRWGYYSYPNRGKKLLTYDYCKVPIKAVEVDKREIKILGSYTLKQEINNECKKIEVKTIQLNWKS